MSSVFIREIDDPSKKQFTDYIVTRYVCAVLGAWCAEFATYPFDLTKTRLQIQNELATSKHGYKMEHKGLISTAVGIVKQEGPLKLYEGLMPMCQRHVIYSGVRLSLYEKMRKLFVNENGTMTLGHSMICGMTCGAIAQLIASPADLIKVLMQAEGRRVLQGNKKRFRGSLDAYKMVYKESGITGFWRGAVPNMQRAALVNLGDLTAYDYVKRLLLTHFQMTDGTGVHVIAALAAGLVAAIFGTPADVLKTRQMNQPVGPDGKGMLYKGMIDCFKQSVTNEGFLALYKGFVPMWLRLGPWALTNWLAFEKIVYLIGGKAF